jgi:hypothetical protein
MFETLGRGVGLCPSGAQVNDLIVILYRENVPCLLRQKLEIDEPFSVSKGHYFVGECYIEGLMDGSAVLVEKHEIFNEVFLLK